MPQNASLSSSSVMYWLLCSASKVCWLEAIWWARLVSSDAVEAMNFSCSSMASVVSGVSCSLVHKLVYLHAAMLKRSDSRHMQRHRGANREGGEAGSEGGGGGQGCGLVLCDDSEALLSLQLLLQQMPHAHGNCWVHQANQSTCMTKQPTGAMQMLH